MKIDPINWKMAGHPINWITIALMLVIAGAIGHLLLQYVGITPAQSKSAYGDVPAGQVPAGDAISAINPQSAGLVS